MNFFTRNQLKFGLLMLAVTGACLLLMEISGQNDSFGESPYTIFYTFIAPALIWYFGIRKYKQMKKGEMAWKEGVRESLKIALVYACTSPFLFLGYYVLINPGIVEYVRTAYNLKNASDTVVIASDMVVQFIFATIGGTLYGAIISFFLKSK